jgi:beta-mannosidase
MKRIDLGGTWQMTNCSNNETISATVPGCNYLDLLAAGKIQDPFWGQNEVEASQVAKEDYLYSRTFEVGFDLLRQPHVELVVSGLDTLATLSLNGQQIARTANYHRTYRLDVKELLREKDNTLEVRFESPYAYIKQREAANPLGGMGFEKGIGHIRKPQYHFGWDWGPNLPPAGISGKIGLEAYMARIEEVRVVQRHADGRVTLSIDAILGGEAKGRTVRSTLIDPKGHKQTARTDVNGSVAHLEFEIEKPQLWWCNGLGEQPLYQLETQLLEFLNVEDEVVQSIGLRTIELDTRTDGLGRQFRFVLNGVPLFAKGADWIPSDSFINRTTYEDLQFYVEQAKWANMNMLRVWGGGYYESDDFYELCDRNGIMVWQDFAFACSAYPFEEAEFLENVHQEVIDAVRRLRHHASLALWCGNNENELMAALWKKKKVTYEANYDFYYNILSRWVSELDAVTPYWFGSPSSGERSIDAASLDHGDNHLWAVWHGLLPVSAFRRMPARFTSEFGLESFPSMRAIRSFTDKPDVNYLDPVMLTHQKSAGGNQKILFYLIDQFRDPLRFEDFVYLSQLSQAQAMRFASDDWRRKMGVCNGSLYWQYNDCWPVASWAGIDYLKQPKAVHYHSRQYNKPVCLSNDCYADRAEIYLANDLPEPIKGKLEWRVSGFDGQVISNADLEVEAGGVEATRLMVLNFSDVLGKKPKNEVVLTVRLISEGQTLDEKTWLLCADKHVAFPGPTIQANCAVKNGQAAITLQSDVFARSVFVELKGVLAPFSDNYFDLLPAQPKIISVAVPEGMGDDDVTRGLHLKSMADVEPKTSLLGDKWTQFKLRFNKVNLSTWLIFKFITRLK